MAFGHVKFWKGDNGWGFIKPEDGTQDVFVHVRELRASTPTMESLKDGQRVQYDTEPGKDGKGPKAVRISVSR